MYEQTNSVSEKGEKSGLLNRKSSSSFSLLEIFERKLKLGSESIAFVPRSLLSSFKTLITPAPVCANMIQILVHTYRVLECSIFVEINIKRQSNPSPFKVFNILLCSAHTGIQPSTISSKYHFKK